MGINDSSCPFNCKSVLHTSVNVYAENKDNSIGESNDIIINNNNNYYYVKNGEIIGSSNGLNELNTENFNGSSNVCKVKISTFKSMIENKQSIYICEIQDK